MELLSLLSETTNRFIRDKPCWGALVAGAISFHVLATF